jgi:hypothetical protein
MKRFFITIPIILSIAFVCLAFTRNDNTTNVKCMIQMTNYTGEGAYVIISLINPEENYEQTLYVQGKDSEWYSEITEWWKFYGKRRADIDAISGATISGGGRTVSLLQIPSDKIGTGYSIRFETAVEDQEYYTKDVQFELNAENIKSKIAGNGFIRYVRMLPQ